MKMLSSFSSNLLLTIIAVAIALVASTPLVVVHAAINWNETTQNLIIRYNASSNSYQTYSNATDGESFGPILAYLDINRTFNQTGWDLLDVSADQDFLFNRNATQSYYAAGRLEATYTWDTIWDSWYNWGRPVLEQVEADAYNIDWLHQHIAYLRTFSADAAASPPQPEYQRQAAKLLAWIDGVVDGYNAARSDMIARGVPLADDSQPLNHTHIFLMSFQDEVGDVNQSNPKYSTNNPDCPPPPDKYNEHCSSITKLTADDLIITHATWSHYRTMLRQYKTYNFENSVTLSGYPGMLVSDDDWYITSNRLVVTETTNNQFNTSLSNQYVKPKTISEFLRVMVACFLATDAKNWIDIFLTENSGTYTNQWIVVNMGLIKQDDIAQGTLPDNTLWIVENIPGPFSESQDMTWFINKHKYWPSFNRPYFKSVADKSCNTYYHEQYGPLWGYYDYCRWEIFKRNQSDVVDIDSMKRLIRYNNWESDPFSVVPWCDKCDPKNGPSLSVAARYDLISPDYWVGTNVSQQTKDYLFPHYDGAIDAKITSFKSFQTVTTSSSSSSSRRRPGFTVKSYIIDGPTNDQQPTFDWSKPMGMPVDAHRGQPDVFDFPWIEVTNSLQGGLSSTAPKATPTWTVVIVTGAIVGVIVIFVVVYKTFFAAENPPSYEEIQNSRVDNSKNTMTNGEPNSVYSPKEQEERKNTTQQPLIDDQ